SVPLARDELTRQPPHLPAAERQHRRLNTFDATVTADDRNVALMELTDLIAGGRLRDNRHDRHAGNTLIDELEDAVGPPRDVVVRTDEQDLVPNLSRCAFKAGNERRVVAALGIGQNQGERV